MFCVAENTFCFICCNQVINGHVFQVYFCFVFSLSSPSVQEHALLKLVVEMLSVHMSCLT